jgi:perosamine synthetase
MSRPMIQVFKPSMGQEELDALAEIFKTGWIGLGPKTVEFETRFAEYVGAKYAIAVNSATAALHLACLALELGPDDEVLVPTMTFVSTAHAPMYCGATTVFVDIDPDTLIIDLRDLEKKISPKTKAIIPVHYGGHACPMEEIWDIAKHHNLFVIEDAAHACGSEYKGIKIGGLPHSDFTCFSFQAVKNLPVGDGGMITTNRVEMVHILKKLRWCGIDKSTWDRTEEIIIEQQSNIRRFAKYGWYYEVHELGYKNHMNDIAAVIGLEQLKKLETHNQRRRQIVTKYNDAFRGIPWIENIPEREYSRSSCHNYVIKTPYRDLLNIYLKDRAIATGVHYMPIHLQPYYRKLFKTTLPVAEHVWTQLLTLPLYPDMTDDDVDYIIDSIKSFTIPSKGGVI